MARVCNGNPTASVTSRIDSPELLHMLTPSCQTYDLKWMPSVLACLQYRRRLSARWRRHLTQRSGLGARSSAPPQDTPRPVVGCRVLTSHGFEGAQEQIGDDILFLLACLPEHCKESSFKVCLAAAMVSPSRKKGQLTLAGAMFVGCCSPSIVTMDLLMEGKSSNVAIFQWDLECLPVLIRKWHRRLDRLVAQQLTGM